MDRVGQQLGNYRLTRLLGQGGFADVYLGEHIHLGTQAAIKVLQGRMSAQDLQDFTKEARTIAGLKHPRVLRVLDFGIERMTPFLVMDYAPKGTLRDRHLGGIPLSVSTILPYVQEVAAALQYAHDQKLIHRDVKPENMLVDINDTILLSDFGIAIAAHKTQSLSTQDAIGTVTYMAPEQIKGKARPASDQYSLAVVVYEWLCGTVPFDGSTSIEIAMSHLTDPPPPLRGKVPTISPTVEQIVLQALEKDPQQRFPTITKFAEALERSSQPPRPAVIVVPNPPASASLPPALPISHSPTLTSLPPTQPTNPMPLNLPPQPDIPTTAPSSSQSVERPISRRGVLIFLVAFAAVSGGLIATVELVDKFNYDQNHLLTLETFTGHSRDVDSVAWSPDGKRVASASMDQTVQVWDATDGGNVFTYRRHSSYVYSVAWSPDGRRIASASADQTVQVWDATDGGNVYVYRGHSDQVSSVAWSPDSKRIASGSLDKTVQVWDAVNGGNVFTYRGHSDNVPSVAWSPDGRYIASASADQTVQVWNAASGHILLTYKGHSSPVSSVAWSPDSKRIVSGYDDYTVQVWDATDGGNVYIYRGHSSYVDAVAWSPDGQRIASASVDQTVQVWDAASGHILLTYKGHSSPVSSVAWSPDGRRIASGDANGTVQVWKAL